MQHREILKTKKGGNRLKTGCLSSEKMIMIEFFFILCASHCYRISGPNSATDIDMHVLGHR